MFNLKHETQVTFWKQVFLSFVVEFGITKAAEMADFATKELTDRLPLPPKS